MFCTMLKFNRFEQLPTCFSSSASLSKLSSVRVCVCVHMNECMCVLVEFVSVCL